MKKEPLEQKLGRQISNNISFYNEYITYLNTDNTLKAVTINQYKGTIINLFDYLSNKDITKYSYDEVEGFLLQFYENPNNFNNKVEHLLRFFKFLEKKYEIYFNIEDLKSIKFGSDEIKKELKRPPKPLTIKEVVKLRNLIKDDYIILFTFEMTYKYGLKLIELVECISQNYDVSKKTFRLKNRDIHVDEFIHNLIKENEKILKHKDKNTYQSYFTKIGKIINRGLNWQDVFATRNLNFLKCPMCDTSYENIPENWSLIQYDEDIRDIKWIICKKCVELGDKL